MRHTAAALAALVALPAGAEAPRAFPWPVRATVLPNGLTVLRVAFPSPGLVSYFTVVRVGSRNEVEPGHTGFAHFFEHMMFRGTRRFPEGARSARLGALGFSENAFTSDDVTVYTVNGPTSHLDALVDVEADRFQNLEYSEEAFQTEAAAVLGEYHKNAASPGLKLEEALLGAAFTRHPYRHTTLGVLDDIRAMPTRYAYSKQFFRRWYTPDNCVVIVVGEFDDRALLERVRAAYGSWAGRAASVAVPLEPPLAGPRTVDVTWPSPTLPRAGLFFRVPASPPGSNESARLTVLGQYLAGPTSPLFTSLVLERQLVERLSPSADEHRDPSLFGVEARLKDEAHRAEVERALEDAVAALAKGVVDERRLFDIRDHLRFSQLMELESPADVAEALALAVGISGDVRALERHQARLSAVTARALVAFARAHLVARNQVRLRFVVRP